VLLLFCLLLKGFDYVIRLLQFVSPLARTFVKPTANDQAPAKQCSTAKLTANTVVEEPQQQVCIHTVIAAAALLRATTTTVLLSEVK
jgi:hypothetical protein